MAKATESNTTSRFHNLSDSALADELGHADALLKGAEAECKDRPASEDQPNLVALPRRPDAVDHDATLDVRSRHE